MKVGQLKTMLSTMSDSEEICLVIFTKDELDEILEEMNLKPATESQWQFIAQRFNRSKAVNQIADETFTEMAYTFAYKLGGRENVNEN